MTKSINKNNTKCTHVHKALTFRFRT